MKKIILGNLIVLSLLSAGCQKALDINSTRVVGEVNMWNSLEDTRAALMGIYGLTRSALADNNAHWIYGDVRPAEFTVTTRQDLKAVVKNNLNADYSSLEALSNWRRWFAVVNSANLFLERVSEVKAKDPRYTENNMTVDIAQARFLRAFAYFYMVRVWGDVPLIISSHDGKFETQKRENQNKVLAFAEQEILSAAEDLPYRYSADDPQQPGDYYNETSIRWQGTLARKLTCYAILSHIAAWQGDYPKVSVYSKFVMDNYSKAATAFVPTDDLTAGNGFFYGKRNSHILGFNFNYSHAEAATTGRIEELTLATPVVNKPIPEIYLSKDSILSIFNEAKDQRFSLDTLGQPVNVRYFSNFNGKYPIFSKIKVVLDGGGSDPTFKMFASTIVFTRLEDIALLRAEALTILGETAQATDILNNNIRANRGLPNYKAEVNGSLIDAIFKERQRELMGEGHRWYDLIRYHKIKRDNKAFIQLIEKDGIYWPVSRTLIKQNGLLTQNSYWK